MWKTTCRECRWTSGSRLIKNAAEIVGECHTEDHPGHNVTLSRELSIRDSTVDYDPVAEDETA